MIARTWRAKATEAGTHAYHRHFENSVLPHLTETEGFIAAYLLSSEDPQGRSLTVVTHWDSLDAIKRFAGPDPSRAVVEEDARKVLAAFDSHVNHHEVLAMATGSTADR